MRLSLGRPRVALIVAPHPDDEIIGAAGLIAVLVRRGVTVHVIVVSDGAASHSGSTRWPRRRLIRARRSESLRALRRLGLPAGATSFLGLPDGSLGSDDGQCRGQVRRSIASCRRLDLVVAPAADDAHPDHRAVATAVARAPGGFRRLAYRVWPAARSRHARTRALHGPFGHAAKRSLIRCHRTQIGVITDDPAGFAIARHELAAFAHPTMRYSVLGR